MKRIVALVFFLVAAAVAQAQSAKPLMLVASPALQGLYSQTTLIVVPAGAGHLGFIVNRATDVKLAALFPQHAPSAKVADPVYFGGPEMVDAIFAVVRRDPGAGAVRLFGELFVVSGADAVDRVIDGMSPIPTRASFSGATPAGCGTSSSSGWATAMRRSADAGFTPPGFASSRRGGTPPTRREGGAPGSSG